MNLLVVRVGINWEESQIPKLKEILSERLPNFIVLVLSGENEDIETKFEVVNLF